MDDAERIGHAPLLLTWPYVIAVSALALNDGVLKSAALSWVTGKLSDFAGLFFAPVLMLMLVELVPWMREHRTFQARRLVCYGSVGAVFSAAQVSDWGARIYELVFLPARWIPTWRGGFALTQDPTDLVALVALVASYLWSSRALSRSGLAGGEGDPREGQLQDDGGVGF